MPRCAILLLVLALPLGASGSTARNGEAGIFFLDLRGGKVVSANPDASDRRVIIDGGLTTIVPVGKTFTGKQLVLDKKNGKLYWSDRASMDMRAGGAGGHHTILAGGFDEAIGIALDLAGRRMFVTDLRGSVYRLALDGTNKRTLFTDQGVLTGIAYAELGANTRR